jgi:hypothetical protein
MTRLPRLLRVISPALLVLVVAAGCTSAGDTHGGATPTTRHAGAPITKTVTERDKGTTVALHVGDRLKVVLANTYWTLGPSAKPAVLRSDGRPSVRPRSNGCVPGAGCGTVVETFTATAKGTASVGASRTSCGEALRCTGDQGVYKVSVVVR